MSRRLVRRGRRDDGAAAVEFALTAPLVFLLLFGIISFGAISAGWLAANNGARQAARFGVVAQRTCTDVANEFYTASSASLGLKWPVTLTVSRPGYTTCRVSIASNGAVTRQAGNLSTQICAGSNTTTDEVTVAASSTWELFVPLWFANPNFPIRGKGVYRCEYT
jgi:Flp pilus assembly protein TadG